MNQSKSACSGVLNVRRLNIYTQIEQHITLNKLIIKKLIKLELSQNSIIIDCLILIYGVC